MNKRLFATTIILASTLFLISDIYAQLTAKELLAKVEKENFAVAKTIFNYANSVSNDRSERDAIIYKFSSSFLVITVLYKMGQTDNNWAMVKDIENIVAKYTYATYTNWSYASYIIGKKYIKQEE